MQIPAIVDEATFRRLVLLGLGMSATNIPATLDTATFRRLALEALADGGGGSSGGFQEVSAPPANPDDFSMFPGGTFPTTGQYLALDDNYIWTLNSASDTSWQQTPRSN